jgi:hypothetical protein
MLYLIGSPPLSGMTIDIGARRFEGNGRRGRCAQLEHAYQLLCVLWLPLDGLRRSLPRWPDPICLGSWRWPLPRDPSPARPLQRRTVARFREVPESEPEPTAGSARARMTMLWGREVSPSVSEHRRSRPSVPSLPNKLAPLRRGFCFQWRDAEAIAERKVRR